jgi:hypothetical protein
MNLKQNLRLKRFNSAPPTDTLVCSAAFTLGRVVVNDQHIPLLILQHPVIVHFVHDVGWNLDLWELIIELLSDLLTLELRHHGRLLVFSCLVLIIQLLSILLV